MLVNSLFKIIILNGIKRNLIILIIPLLLLILNLLFVRDLGYQYISCFDPSYNYLLNGLTLASGKMDIGIVEHPGIPLQMLCGLIIRIVFFFSKDKNLMESVLSSSETYLSTITYVIICINITIVYLLGKAIYKHSGSVYTAVLFQLTTLVSLVSVYSMRVIACESMLLILSIMLVLLAFKQTYSPNKLKQGSLVFWFAIIAALLVTVKTSAATMLLLPVLILQGYGNKLKYIGLTSVFIAIILIPIYSKLWYYWSFIAGIFTHSGKYGQGQESILIVHDYFLSLFKIFTSEIPFTFFYLIILIAFLLCAFKYKWFANVNPNQKRLLIAIFIVMTLQIAVVSRHFSFHYLLPVYSLAILGVYSVYQIIKPNFKILGETMKSQVAWCLCILIVLLFFRAIYHYHFFPGFKNPAYKTVEFLEKNSDKASVILAERYKESAFPEQAFYFSTAYCGQLKNQYRNFLKQKYIKTYFYDMDEAIYNWDKHFMKEELMMKYPKLMLYVKYNSIAQRDLFISQFLKLKIPDGLYKCNRVFNSPESHETIYLLESDTFKIKKLIIPYLTIRCDMENCSNDSAKFSDLSRYYQFDKAFLRTNEKFHNGKNSIKLSYGSPYGCDIQIPVDSGNFIRIRVWRYPQGKKAVIAASSNLGQAFYSIGESIVQKAQNGWELIELAFYLPLNYSNNNVNIFLWNIETNDVYFDDLSIEVYK
jgi:hypothetical protein